MPKQHRKAVLFVCTGNAGRSQMAAALFSSAAADDIDVYSAGVDPWPHLHPVAVRLLEGRGIETGDLCPKHVCGFTQTPLDWVVTIGDRARAETPIVDSKPTCVHWPITDPAEADGTGREEAVFRGTLAAIEDRLPRLLAAVQRGTSASALHLEPGLSTCIVRPSRFDPPVHLPVLASAGFTCVELNCYQGSDDFPWDRPARVKELCRTADETGVRVYSVHADGGLGAYRGDRSERFAVDVCKTYADLAAELGASIVTIHAGLPGDASPSEGKELLGRSLEALSSHVRDMPCAFGWENEARGLSPAEHIDWIRRLGADAFALVLDTGHSNLDNTGDAYLDGCAGVLNGLHLNDNDSTADAHRLPGKGTVRWDAFASLLDRVGYTGPLMLEVEARDRQDDLEAVLSEARASVEFVRRGHASRESGNVTAG